MPLPAQVYPPAGCGDGRPREEIGTGRLIVEVSATSSAILRLNVTMDTPDSDGHVTERWNRTEETRYA